MAASPVDERVRALAATAAESAGLVLEDVTVTPMGRRRVLRVVVDLPEDRSGGVPMDAVATASQALSAALDGSDVMGGAPYVLEVSSPGVDRPLTQRRHFVRNRGRLVRLVLRDGSTVTGRLAEAGADDVTLDDGRTVALADVARAHVEVEFNPPGHDDADLATLDEGDDDGDDDTADDTDDDTDDGTDDGTDEDEEA